jgi:predicted membrane channel-forming protein YqfA (hemolysin III family)
LNSLTNMRRVVLGWFGISALVCLALIPIRLYLLSADDWLAYMLLVLGFAFLGAFLVLIRAWKPRELGEIRLCEPANA